MENLSVDNRIIYDENLFSAPGYHWVTCESRKASWLLLIKSVKGSFIYTPAAYIKPKDEDWYEIHHVVNIGGENNINQEGLGVVYYINKLDFDLKGSQELVLDVEGFCMKNSLKNSLKKLMEFNFQLDNFELPNLEVLFTSKNTVVSNTVIRSLISDKIYTGTTEDGSRTYIFVSKSPTLTGNLDNCLEAVGFIDMSYNDSVVILNISTEDKGFPSFAIKGSSSCMSIEDIIRYYLGITSSSKVTDLLNIISSNEFEFIDVRDINVGWKY